MRDEKEILEEIKTGVNKIAKQAKVIVWIIVILAVAVFTKLYG